MRRIWDAIVRQFQTLDLLTEYFLSVKAEAWNLAWGPGLIAIAFCLWWFQRTTPMPSVDIALFLGGSLVLAGYYLWRADHLHLIQKITLRFENREPFTQMTPIVSPDLILRKYFRFFPECSSPVANCAAYLLAVFREIDGQWKPTPFNEAVLLKWADGRVGQITVEPGIGPYLELFYVDSFEKEIVPCTAHPMLRTSTMFRERAEERVTFRFDVKVTNGAPISLKVKMDERPSYWDRPLIELLANDEK
jgi:hypothetical protein